MGFDKVKIKQVCFIMLYVAVLILVIIHSELLFAGLKIVGGIFLPFIIGGVMAFILNIPMSGIENKWFKKWHGKVADKSKRPISLVLALIFVALIVTLVIVAVVPQLRITFQTLGATIPPFIDKVLVWLQNLLGDYPELKEKIATLDKIEFNWEAIIGNLGGFLKNGVGNMLGSTITVAGNIIGGIVNVFIAFVFAIYILSQKEKLQNQAERILDAYTAPKWNARIREVSHRLYVNFKNFICGQCLEAVVLGSLFIIFMTIFQLPYAVMIGTLIGFTSLIPIVGAFIGCGVGAFMILIDNPIQALWFVVLFLIIQQLEGNLIYPKVVGDSVGLPSIWVLMSVTVGGSMFGVAGMLVFIPLMSTLYSLLRDDVNRRNGKKGGKKRGERLQNNQQNKEAKGNNSTQKKRGKQEKPITNTKAEKQENQEESTPEQIVARLVAEQEVKVKNELEQELKETQPKPKNAPQKKPENKQKPAEPVAEASEGTVAKPKKKNNYYRNRNRRKQNKPQD